MITWYWLGFVVVAACLLFTVHDEWDSLTEEGKGMAIATSLFGSALWPISVTILFCYTAYEYYFKGEVTWWN